MAHKVNPTKLEYLTFDPGGMSTPTRVQQDVQAFNIAYPQVISKFISQAESNLIINYNNHIVFLKNIYLHNKTGIVSVHKGTQESDSTQQLRCQYI